MRLLVPRIMGGFDAGPSEPPTVVLNLKPRSHRLRSFWASGRHLVKAPRRYGNSGFSGATARFGRFGLGEHRIHYPYQAYNVSAVGVESQWKLCAAPAGTIGDEKPSHGALFAYVLVTSKRSFGVEYHAWKTARP